MVDEIEIISTNYNLLLHCSKANSPAGIHGFVNSGDEVSMGGLSSDFDSAFEHRHLPRTYKNGLNNAHASKQIMG